MSGRVLRADGSPIAGARIVGFSSHRLEILDRTGSGRSSENTREAESDAAGRFELDTTGIGWVVDLLVESEGFAPSIAATCRRGNSVDVVLASGGTLEGRVTDVHGRAIAGARVRFLAELEPVILAREAVSDEEGRFACRDCPRFDPLDSGDQAFPLRVEASAEGFAPLRMNDWFALREAVESARPVGLTMGVGTTVSGSVVDGETGEPLADARVILWHFSQSRDRTIGRERSLSIPNRLIDLAETRTDGAGRFHFAPVGAYGASSDEPFEHMRMEGHLAIAAIPRSHAPAAGLIYELVECGTVERELRCDPACTVRGRVLDSHGAPVGGVPVEARSSGHLEPWYEVFDSFGDDSRCFVESEPTGRFELDRVPVSLVDPPYTALRVSLERSGGRGAHRDMFFPIETRRNATIDVGDLVLPAIDRAIVRVLDPDGSPICGATIDFIRGNGLDRSIAVTAVDGRAQAIFGRQWDRQGGGKRRIVVKARGFAPALPPPIEIHPGEPADVAVRLELPRRLSGVVVDPDGAPIRFAEVMVFDGREPAAAWGCLACNDLAITSSGSRVLLARLLTGPGGRFLAEDLPAGPWHVLARSSHPDLAAWSRIDVDLVEPSRIVLAPRDQCVRLVLRCVDSWSGNPVERIDSARSFDPSGNALATEIVEGRIICPEFPIGVNTIEVLAPGYAAIRETIDVFPSESATEVLVELERACTILCSITDPRLHSGNLVQLHLRDVESGVVLGGAVHPDGWFESDSIRTGAAFVPSLAVGTTRNPLLAGTGTEWTTWLIQGTRTIVVSPSTRFAEIRGDLIPAGHLQVLNDQYWARSLWVEVADAAGIPIIASSPLPDDGISELVPEGEYVVGVTEDGVSWERRHVVVAAHRWNTVVFGEE